MTEHLHSLANYPTEFKGTVISPTKICLQFQDVQVKFRRNLDSTEWLKMPDGHRAVAISDTGTDIALSSMGCQIPVLEDMQLRLITAYRAYYKFHGERYKKEYGKDFFYFLLQLNEELGILVGDIMRGDLVPEDKDDEDDKVT